MKKLNVILCIVFSITVTAQEVAKKRVKTAQDGVLVFTTAENTNLRLTSTDRLFFEAAQQPQEREISVFVTPDKTYQTVLGIGGAITDASAEVYGHLTKDLQDELLKAYYDKEKGIGYTLLRTTIHSSDFSSSTYTYIKEGDKSLTTFNVDHDRKYRIPLLKAALKVAEGNIKIYASPWSPPAFMKSNNNMLKGGMLLPEYYQPWANYYVKFIEEYQKEGIPIWGLTLQNEPMAVQTWESCIYTAEQERDFLKLYLGPILKDHGFSEKKIIVWDHNRDLLNHRADVIFSDPDAAKYAWGIGFHWYEDWTGGKPMFDNVKKVNEDYPEKNILFTEGCIEKFNSEKLQFWPNAEKYGISMINDFNNGTIGWTDWNILLDQYGGPNHVGNYCFAPIHADLSKNQLIYTPTYYYIGHFSKFVRPGAKRVSTAVSRSNLLSATFSNSDGSMVTIVLNSNSEQVSYNLFVKMKKVNVNIPPHAIQTIIY